MPCYDSRDHEPRVEYRSGISPEKLQESERRGEYLEACLCAILSELERRGIAAEVAAESSRNGLIDIMGMWTAHTESDEARIAKLLHTYSKDEQAVMRKLLSA